MVGWNISLSLFASDFAATSSISDSSFDRSGARIRTTASHITKVKFERIDSEEVVVSETFACLCLSDVCAFVHSVSSLAHVDRAFPSE
jgi:hypothetical protein